MKKTLRVTMLGSFELRYGGELVGLRKRKSAKPLQLLQLLLYHRESGVSRQGVIEALYGPETGIDTANNLNVTVSQLRRLLRDTGLPEESYILADVDRYRFRCSFPVETDTEEVLALRREAQGAGDREKTALLERLCALYRGRLLPDLDGESWVEEARGYYQGLYQESMGELCRLLWDAGEHRRLLRLTERAAKLFPFDEWQAWQYESLLAQGRMREAQELYRAVEKLYLSELDAPPPDRMRQRIHTPARAPWWEARSVLSIRDQLNEASREGPYCLPFPSFLDAYQLISRMSGAVGQPICLMLCTLRGGGSRSREERERFRAAVEQLEAALCRSLRQEDTFTRYSRSQYLVVLVGVEEADCGVIARRVTAQFRDAGQGFPLECQAVTSGHIQMSGDRG